VLGERKVKLMLSGQHFEWTSLQAEVQMAILGIDFQRAFKLSVDPAAGKMVQDNTGLTLSTISLSSGPTASVIVSSTVPGSGGQAAPSLSAVHGPEVQAASSASAVSGLVG
jgi:hypothetical protein